MTTDVEALIGDLVRMCMRAAEALRSQAERIQALEAKCAELERDAGRYRWLRSYNSFSVEKIRLEWYLPRYGKGSPSERLDADIDAHIAAQAGSKE